MNRRYSDWGKVGKASSMGSILFAHLFS